MLRSGNGRHRRPRPTPRLVIAAGVTGAGVALPLVGVTSAQAASGSTWDKVAICESGNDWSLNTGNGSFGGLQLSEKTWEAYGGSKLAPRPDLASRFEQISVAEKILADQGPGAWPSCGLKVSLKKGEPAPQVPEPQVPQQPRVDAPGVVSEPLNAPTAPTHSTHSPSGTHSTPTHSTDGTPSAPPATGLPTHDGGSPSDGTSSSPSGTPSQTTGSSEAPTGSGSPTASDSPSSDPGSATATAKTPKHAAGSTERDGDTERASRAVTGRHRLPADDDHYTVAKGDTLSRIADHVDVKGGWSALYDANKHTVGQDPDLILPGQQLNLG